MHELTQDPFYELIDKEHDRCIIDYCLILPDAPYRGILSHREAVLFAMLKMIERYLVEQRASEEKWAEEVAGDFFPWSLDFGKAKGRPFRLVFVSESQRIGGDDELLATEQHDGFLSLGKPTVRLLSSLVYQLDRTYSEWIFLCCQVG